MLCLSVVFQNKVVEKDYELYNADKVLLHPSDCQSLGVKSGSLIEVEFAASSQPPISILCKAWVYSKLTKGSSIMSKMWTPNATLQTNKQTNNSCRIQVKRPPPR